MTKKALIVIFGLVLGQSMLGQAVSRMEADFRALEARFEAREKNVAKDLKTYMKQYPYTTYEDEIHYMAGTLEVERGQYKQGLKDLERVNYKRLSVAHEREYLFNHGYALLMGQEYSRAAALFKVCLEKAKGETARDERTRGVEAKYYYSYCLYKQQKYDEALPLLIEIENVAKYKKSVPYYIAQIYYSKGEYDTVEERAEQLLAAQPEDANNAELERMLGEIYYRKGDYAQAIRHLSAYEEGFRKQGTELVRNDLYLLGVACYEQKRYAEAVRYLKQVKDEKDEISESAYLTIGHAQRQLGQTEAAKMAYQAAMAVGKTPEVTEEAMYNYTLCTSASSTAIGESVTAFTSFVQAYPESKHTEEVYMLMSDALRQSKNYRAALETLTTIAKPNKKMLETIQYLRFQLGTDAFLQGKWSEAKRWMTEAIGDATSRPATSGQGDVTIATEAYYWRAEAEYRLKDYKAADKDIQQFLSHPEARRSPNYAAALYTKGYIAFNEQRYPEAAKTLEQYLALIEVDSPNYADAVNRLGDCAFSQRELDKAIGYYGQVVALDGTGADYAMFQKAYAQGLKHQYDKKIETLENLVRRYKSSDYADDALYEIARAEVLRENERGAIAAYEGLLAGYPNSPMAKKSSLEIAMLYRNLGETEKAIAAYKQTIRTYPASQEAYTALRGLETLCIENNRVDEYVGYTAQLQKLNMNVSLKEDSLCYAAAELQYRQAHYDEAAVNYKKLSDRTGSIYRAEACKRVAEISYDKQDYATALEYFEKLLPIAASRADRDIARLGVLRCSRLLGLDDKTLTIASQILADAQTEDNLAREALYCRAKALLAKGQHKEAAADLVRIADEVRTAEGAEAKYLLAECYYEQGLLQEAEAEIMAFAGMNTQQQYWLARALILLSDINLKQGDSFQAKQYLLSLQANYKQADDIQARVAERLNDNHNDNANDNDNDNVNEN